jgi:hypothetical protein
MMQYPWRFQEFLKSSLRARCSGQGSGIVHGLDVFDVIDEKLLVIFSSRGKTHTLVVITLQYVPFDVVFSTAMRDAIQRRS